MKFLAPLAFSSTILLGACGGGGGGGNTTPTPQPPSPTAAELATEFMAIVLLNSTENLPLHNHTVAVVYPCLGTPSPQVSLTRTPSGERFLLESTITNCNDGYATTSGVQRFDHIDTGSALIGSVDYSGQTDITVGNKSLSLRGEADAGFAQNASIAFANNTLALDLDSAFEICSNLKDGDCTSDAGKELLLTVDGTSYAIAEFNYVLNRRIKTTFSSTDGQVGVRTPAEGDIYDYEIAVKGKLLDDTDKVLADFESTSSIIGTIAGEPTSGTVLMTVTLSDNTPQTVRVIFDMGNISMVDNTTDAILLAPTPWADFQ